MAIAAGLMDGFLLLSLPVRAAEEGPQAGDVARGAKAWAENCMRCHNVRDPREFRDDLWKPIVFHMRVRAGLPGQTARDILAFLQASNSVSTGSAIKPVSLPLKQSPETKGDITSGKQIFQQTCIACHGADGEGAMPGVPDLTDKKGALAKSDGELLKNMMQGYQSPGSPMAMPPKGGNPALTEQDMNQVLNYMRKEFSQ